MIALRIATGVEERAGPVEGCAGLQCQHGQTVGTSTLLRGESILPQVAVVVDNPVLDVVTLVDDELKHFVGRVAREGVHLVGCHHMVDQGHAAIGLHQIEVVIGTHEAGFVLVVVVAVQLCLVVGILLQFREGLAQEVLQVVVDRCNALEHLRPSRGQALLGVGGTPGTVVEILDGIAYLAVFALVGGRCQHGSAGEVAEVIVYIVVEIGHEAAHIDEVLGDIVLVVDIILLILHPVAT